MYNTSEYVYLDEYITQVGQGGKAIHRKVIQDCLKIPPSFLHLFWIHNRCKSNKASRDAESTISLWAPVEEKGLLRINIFLAFLKVWFWGRPNCPGWKWVSFQHRKPLYEKSRPQFPWLSRGPIYQRWGSGRLNGCSSFAKPCGSSGWPPGQFSLEVNESCLVWLGI